jgi:hypothetical protein
VRFAGQHYRVVGVKPGPAPAHPIGIWVGAYVPSERLGAAQARVDEAAVRRLYNISGRIGPAGGGFLDGPPGQWVDQLLLLVVETGMDTFVLWPSESPASQLERFAAEVAPALREAVAAHRGGA